MKRRVVEKNRRGKKKIDEGRGVLIKSFNFNGGRQHMKAILIVEDSATTRSLIRAVVEEAGNFETIEAATGFEALKHLPSRSFDLIITDINMPDINGLELINFVKTNPRYSHIPTIIISTEKSEEDRKRGLAMGATAYITKPFKAKDLQDTIKQVLGL